jgi:hypothetical protein
MIIYFLIEKIHASLYAFLEATVGCESPMIDDGKEFIGNENSKRYYIVQTSVSPHQPKEPRILFGDGSLYHISQVWERNILLLLRDGSLFSHYTRHDDLSADEMS